MTLNYRLVCAKLDDGEMLGLLNAAIDFSRWRDPSPEQIEVCVAAVCMARKVHGARQGNVILFWPLSMGNRWPYPEALKTIEERGGQLEQEPIFAGPSEAFDHPAYREAREGQPTEGLPADLSACTGPGGTSLTFTSPHGVRDRSQEEVRQLATAEGPSMQALPIPSTSALSYKLSLLAALSTSAFALLYMVYHGIRFAHQHWPF